MHLENLRKKEIEGIVSRYEAVASARQGQVVFLAGDDQGGRMAVLEACAEQIREKTPRPAIVGGCFRDGAYIPWEQDVAVTDLALKRLTAVLSTTEAIASLGELVMPPISHLLGQIISKSKAALEVASTGLSSVSTSAESMNLLPRALRRLCEDQPTACFIEVGDGTAGGLWADLAAVFARRLSYDLPLLLVFALDGPPKLGPPTDDEPEALHVARQLSAENVEIGSWHWLPPLSENEVERLVGSAEREVIRSLLEITGGQGGWTEHLWDDWKARGVVEDLSSRKWRFAAGGARRRLDDVDDALGERLKRLFDGKAGPVDRAQSILACGALEGRRFTAPAVAAALELDRDETIDFIDDFLLWGSADGNGFLNEEGFATVEDERGVRHLPMYFFERELDWLALRYHGLSEGERKHLSRRLADALHMEYGGQARRVAPALAQLYKVAGIPDAAGDYRRLADNGVSRDLLLWRARTALDLGSPKDRRDKARRCQLLIAAASEISDSGPFSEGLLIAEKAGQLAERPKDTANAFALSGSCLMHLGSYKEAGEAFEAAKDVFASLGRRSLELEVRRNLASVAWLRGRFQDARRELEDIFERLRPQERRLSAYCHLEFAQVSLFQGRLNEAQQEAARAEAIFGELGHRRGLALSWQALAGIDARQGSYEAAREKLEAVIAVHRETRASYFEAEARRGLGTIHFRLADHDAAQREFEAVLDLFIRLGDHRGESAAHHELGLVHGFTGDLDSGRQHLTTALEMARERGDRYGEACALHDLRAIEPLSEWGSDVEGLLESHRALGDRLGEARALYMLALQHRAAEDFDRALSELDEVLVICDEETDRPLLAGVLFSRAVIWRQRKDLVAAIADLQRAQAVCLEVGDTVGEESARIALEEIHAIYSEGSDQAPPKQTS